MLFVLYGSTVDAAVGSGHGSEAFAIANEGASLLPDLEAYVDQNILDFERIPAERRELLDDLASYVRSQFNAGDPARLTFICTHNSRRSHMSQIWAQTAAAYYGVGGVETFSGGTEATAFNPRAVAAMRRAGFDIQATSEGENPVYAVRYGQDGSVLEAFSKIYSDPPNPAADFCAVMTCSQADEACPYVRGSSYRVAIPYEDPKAFDGTDQESKMYDERCQQIGREMFYVFSKVGD
jgi:protein-tyrosine phosphatase/arsenate reductase